MRGAELFSLKRDLSLVIIVLGGGGHRLGAVARDHHGAVRFQQLTRAQRVVQHRRTRDLMEDFW